MKKGLLAKFARKNGRTDVAVKAFNTLVGSAVESNEPKKPDNVYGEWEYHPVYGTYSRAVYVPYSNNNVVMVGREYKPLAV